MQHIGLTSFLHLLRDLRAAHQSESPEGVGVAPTSVSGDTRVVECTKNPENPRITGGIRTGDLAVNNLGVNRGSTDQRSISRIASCTKAPAGHHRLGSVPIGWAGLNTPLQRCFHWFAVVP